ncbi:hypothetical protein GTO91_12100 [Heliobacterium undosum]|uniref:Uncharacterized protein n=1 Tax=Heliomicrobium undosum TaxID=121734 RepID=A0A845L5X9_9FIRM|nr:hypothetical protein [Heliomicrobium undosum]MZP30455.1 hypothetical protein [Heliomicrobium undosum]
MRRQQGNKQEVFKMTATNKSASSMIMDKFLNMVQSHNLVPKECSKIVIFYSGGKDASVLAHLFDAYRQTHRPDLTITLITIPFPKMIYQSPDETQQKLVQHALSYWKSKGFTHRIATLPEGLNDSVFDGVVAPCRICEKVKTRIAFEELCKEEYAGSVVAVGHTVEDIAGYLSELFYIGSAYDSWQEMRESAPTLFARVVELSRRLHPKNTPFAHQGKITYIKPLIELEEDLLRQYAREQDFPCIPENCAEVRSKDFVMYKRFVMTSIEWLRGRYQYDPEISSTFLFRNYLKMMDRYASLGFIPPLEEIQKMNIEAGF